MLGKANAPVTVVEFTDYQCPYCRRFYQTTYPQLKKKYVDTGQVRWIVRNLPLGFHADAIPAAMAAHCAGDQGKYWEYHETLFRNQARWSSASMPSSAFEQYASDVGIDGGEFKSCLNSEKYADVVTANMQLGQRMGVNGTPSIFLNADGQTRRLNNYDFQSVTDAIAELTGSGPGES